MSNVTESVYKWYPQTLSEDDFWGQVRRTINGEPIDPKQIGLIVDTITESLNLNKDDFLLDLCCGNGALSHLIFKQCRGGIGVDFAEYLISIADKYFSIPNRESYILSDVLKYVEDTENQVLFTKAFCFGSIQYMPTEIAENLIRMVYEKLSLSLFYIGNIPDLSKLDSFFSNNEYKEGIENDPLSPIGVWWQKEDFEAMATGFGWSVRFTDLPDDYYASHYRFNAILEK